MSKPWTIPYYATVGILVVAATPDGPQHLVFAMSRELPEGGLQEAFETLETHLRENDVRPVTQEEYAQLAQAALQQEKHMRLTEAAKKFERDRKIDAALAGDIFKLHTGREGGDA